MNKLTFTAALLFVLPFFGISQTQVIFVKTGSTGDGRSWGSAMGSLHGALGIAAPGTEIWVAKGTYFPIACENCGPAERAVAFEVPSGVRVFGGFAGHETSVAERDWQANATVLSGNIGRDDYLDNSQTVVRFEDVDAATLLDGFFIADGYADAEGKPGTPSRSGAGVFNVCTRQGGCSRPTISNCRFLDNQAWEGAAIFNHGQEGAATATITGCAFVRNRATVAGGAILDHNQGAVAHSSVSDSRFVLNSAQYGACYFTNKTNLDGAIFRESHFIKNKSEQGPVCYMLHTNGQEKPFLKGCTFSGNVAKEGGDNYLTENASLPNLKKVPVKL